jgi:drug/metabolite transporter (DMT)-like permease
VTGDQLSRAAAARATLQILLSACGFGAIAIFVTLAQRAGTGLLTVLSWRYLVGGLCLGLIAALGRELRFSRQTMRVALWSGLGQSIIAITSLSALRYIPAGTLAFLFYTYPAWVAIIARVRHSEPLTPIRLFALGMSLAGIFVMVGAPGVGSTALHPVGVTLALVAAFLYAGYIPMLNALQRGLSPLATATHMSIGSAVFLSLAAATRQELITPVASTALLAIVGLALISTVAAFQLFLGGLRVLGPVRTAIISTVEPFFTALLGAALLGQPLTPSTLLGGLFIAAAVVLLQLRTNNSGP